MKGTRPNRLTWVYRLPKRKGNVREIKYYETNPPFTLHPQTNALYLQENVSMFSPLPTRGRTERLSLDCRCLSRDVIDVCEDKTNTINLVSPVFDVPVTVPIVVRTKEGIIKISSSKVFPFGSSTFTRLNKKSCTLYGNLYGYLVTSLTLPPNPGRLLQSLPPFSTNRSPTVQTLWTQFIYRRPYQCQPLIIVNV